MLMQMLFQDQTNPDHVEFVAQADIQSSDQLQQWTRGVVDRHPLPEGKQWLACDETAPCFVRAIRTYIVDEQPVG